MTYGNYGFGSGSPRFNNKNLFSSSALKPQTPENVGPGKYDPIDSARSIDNIVRPRTRGGPWAPPTWRP